MKWRKKSPSHISIHPHNSQYILYKLIRTDLTDFSAFYVFSWIIWSSLFFFIDDCYFIFFINYKCVYFILIYVYRVIHKFKHVTEFNVSFRCWCITHTKNGTVNIFNSNMPHNPAGNAVSFDFSRNKNIVFQALWVHWRSDEACARGYLIRLFNLVFVRFHQTDVLKNKRVSCVWKHVVVIAVCLRTVYVLSEVQ